MNIEKSTTIMQKKRWVIKQQGDSAIVETLSKELNIPPVLSNLLAQRGVRSFEDARQFFRPTVDDLHNPFEMLDMDKAVARIEQAFENQEKILVYGDYDVDGTTSVALMYSFLKTQHEQVSYYIPDRYKEGYGISTIGIDWAKENGFTLIISLDCGIKSIDKVDYANTLGIDFIICDHHLPSEQLPKAIAILDPKRPNCPYPFKELSGCGVGFKLAQAFAQKNNVPFSEIEQYFDLAAVSIAADIVEISGENRVLTHFGLNWLNAHPRPGIKALLDLSNFKRKLTVSDIVFTIGPRINAAGRIEDAKQAVALLISSNQEDAVFEGKSINEKNLERRTLDTAITEHAIQLIEDDDDYVNRKSTVVYHHDWHKGVIGIVASRLTDKFYRPTIVLTQSNGMVSGSARSVKDFDIYNAIEACSELLEQFGGHKYAAGLTLKVENVEAFKMRFEEVVSNTIEERMLTQEIEIDCELELEQITPKFFNVLKQFAPFGPGNLNPVFVTRGVCDKGFARIVGSNHLKLNIKKTGMPDIYFDAIGFQLGAHFEYIRRGLPFDICYSIEENEWNGQVSLQLNVKDIRFQA